MDSITIGIPTCNRPKLLFNAIDSAVNQTRRPDQILVSVDSNGGDYTNLIQEYFEKINFSSYRVILNSLENGQGANVSNLFNNSITDGIILLHDDDSLCPNAVEELYKAYRLDSENILSFGKQICVDDKGVLKQVTLDSNNIHYNRNFNEYKVFSLVESVFLKRITNIGFLVKTDCAIKAKLKNNSQFGFERKSDIYFLLRLAEEFPESKCGFSTKYISRYRISGNLNAVSKQWLPSFLFFLIKSMKVDSKFDALKSAYMSGEASSNIDLLVYNKKNYLAFKIFVSKEYWLDSSTSLFLRGKHFLIIMVPGLYRFLIDNLKNKKFSNDL